MTKTWEKVRDFLPMVAILLLCMVVMPATQAYADTNSNGATATTVQQPQEPAQIVTEGKATVQPTKKATATKPREKSVLDADVLESPLAYFRDAFSSEEEESDTAAAGASIVVVTLKALIATLLSTVI